MGRLWSPAVLIALSKGTVRRNLETLRQVSDALDSAGFHAGGLHSGGVGSCRNDGMERTGADQCQDDKMTSTYLNSGRVSKILPAAIVAILVILSAVFRRAELGPPALRVDDAWVALISRHSWRDIWWTSLTSVGFRAIIGAFIQIFGDSTTAAQLFPFVAGLATIPATYFVARKLYTHKVSALFSAAVVAASPLLVTYSTRVKQYTGDALLTLSIVASVIWVLENPRQSKRWWLLTLVSCLSIAFSGQLLLVVGPAVAASIICSWESRREWIRVTFPALVILVTSSAFWYLAILKPVASSDELLRMWGNNYIVTDKGLIPAATSFARGVYRLVEGAIGGSRFTLIGAGVLFVSALVWRRTAALLLLLPVLAAIVAAAAGRAPIGARTDCYLVPLIALVMAMGFDSLFRPNLHAIPPTLQPCSKYFAIALGISVLVIALPKRITPTPYQLQDVRSLTKIWEQHRTENDALIVYPGAQYGFALYSNEKLAVRPRRPPFTVSSTDPRITILAWELRDEPERYMEEVRKSVDSTTDRVWVLAAHTWKGDVPSLKRAVTALGFSQQSVWTTNGDAELTLYTRIPSQ